MKVRLSDIVLDRAYQVRSKLTPSSIKRYSDAMRVGHEFPPIHIALVNRVPVVIDGWHRVKAARSIGLHELPAILIEKREEELAWYAAKANLSHGNPLKRREALAVFKAYVRAGKHKKRGRAVKSSREIAQDLHGLRSHVTILAWMKMEFPSIYRRMGAHDEDTRGGGGLALSSTPQERHLSTIRRALDEVEANARGVIDAEARGQLISEIERLREVVRQGGAWTPPPEDEDDWF